MTIPCPFELSRMLAITWFVCLEQLKHFLEWGLVLSQREAGTIKGTTMWNRQEPIRLDRQARRIMRQHDDHQYSSCRERMFLPRKEVSRGLQSAEQIWERETVSVTMYLLSVQEHQIRAIMDNDRRLENAGAGSYLGEARC